MPIQVRCKKGDWEKSPSDCLLVLVSQVKSEDKADRKTKASSKVDLSRFSSSWKELLKSAETKGTFSGARKEQLLIRKEDGRAIIFQGLGPSNHITTEVVRQAIGLAYPCIKSLKNPHLEIALDPLLDRGISAEAAGQALTEGLLLSAYSFDELKTKDRKAKDNGLETVVLSTRSESVAAEVNLGVESAEVVSECVNFARRLGDLPGNLMTPTILAEEATKFARGSKIKVKVMGKAQIEKESMGAFLSVAKGSSQEPKFIVLEYQGASVREQPLCFVGKGLTFDSGGISIKPSAGMEEMKYDMCGGANVIASVIAMARLGLKVNACAIVPATENMPGPGANKPGDIVRAKNGKTIEVNNTDAEGRLILADALVYALNKKPALIVDAATLTGAIVMALGNIHTGVFTRNDDLYDKVARASERAGELIWRMPLTDYHLEDMKGTYADLSNVSSQKGAGSATAAAFLEQFVDSTIPWAHFDIAGTAWSAGNRVPYHPKKGATGVMIRTFVELAREHQS